VLLQGFLHNVCQCVRCWFQPASAMFQPASAVPCTRIDSCLRSVHARKCSRASSPQAWAQSRRSGHALRLVHTPLRRPSAGQGVRCPRLPSSGSRIVGSSLSYYRVIQVDVRAPFDKGRIVVRRHVHESAHVGVLCRARSCSLGTEGAKALPRWDPSTSCPCWLLNTTCGAPSSW
jgi:hypothetical protein